MAEPAAGFGVSGILWGSRPLGRTGICFDNAVSESFFATYKKELIHTCPWPMLANLEKGDV